MTIAVIHQPDFLPHLAFFHRLLSVDLFVILDDAQFVRGTRNAWQNRDKIKTLSGAEWLTVPVQKCPLGTPINAVNLADDTSWRDNNLDQIRRAYSEAPYYEQTMEEIYKLYKKEYEKLIDINMGSIRMLLKLFDIDVKIIFASNLGINSKSNERLAEILKNVGADRYLSGLGAKNYYDPLPFNRYGIKVIWQEFSHPVYPQLHGTFMPYLSSIDLLFNCGPKEGRQILENI